MHKFAYLTLGIAAALGASGALGEATRPLDAISACRLDEARIVLRFTFEGGACQQPGQASLLPEEGGIGNVTAPTENVGEVCTMQIVPIQFAQTIDAAKDITTLDITVLNPEGRPQALGSTDIVDDDDKECVEPEPKPAQ